jgi:hypothetical protein
VLPEWDEALSLLSWRFRVLFSQNFVESDILDQLDYSWTVDDYVLDWAFDQDTYDEGRDKVIPYQFFRDEATYKIKVNLEDENTNYNYQAQVSFVPSLSHWMEAEPCCYVPSAPRPGR